MRPAFVFLVLSIPVWAWQEPQVALSSQVRQRMAANLASLPNYTCLETIERTVRRQATKKLLFRDRIHVEVAFLDANETFSWPGAASFDPDLLQKIPQVGASGAGGFGGWTRSLFGPSAPNFADAGECVVDSRRGSRYNFSVPASSSTYSVKAGSGDAMLPYMGSLCVDPDALEIMQLEIRAGQVPPPVAAIAETIHYGRTRIGGADFLLPQDHELSVTDVEGNENRNFTRFTACREFTSESTIAFDTEHAAAPVPQTKTEELQIPGGISLDLQLETPIAFEESAVGDPIAARLTRAVKSSGVSIPKGALVSGRILGLGQYLEPERYFVVSLEFSSLTFGGTRGMFRARLVGPRLQAEKRLDASGMAIESDMSTPVSGISTPGSSASARSGLDIVDDSASGSGSFRVRGGNLRLRRGLRMVWETR